MSSLMATMISGKSDKEMAFLHDLYVSTDWGERFAELIDEHVKLPKSGRVLYVAAGTGGHVLAMQERADDEVTIIGVDESEERLKLAREKAAVVKAGGRIEFRAAQLETLAFEDDLFDLVVGDASMVAPERLPEVLAEMVRVAKPGARVALNVVTASSFGEFFSIYWEALINVGMLAQSETVETLINELPTVAGVEALAATESLDKIESWTRPEEFDFASGDDFQNAPLIKDFLLSIWLEPLPDGDSQIVVTREIARIIDEERNEAEFSLSVKATLVVGRKAN